ncbi:trans-aconitate 2-methyltransferase [Kiloniella laminariae]|uniref:trans-aconitate 2-methyltransferase n=1 Tax=Kiloniella laminariae TaxID=454162 RepID=UPI0003647BDF|nr:trans-aconitate 2-methyltransferase [Kiloniella laminariae]
MADWDAELYLLYEAMRTRPATELLEKAVAHLGSRDLEQIVDLGCGPGNSTELLVREFPEASVIGLDSSPAMLERARERFPHVKFVQDDIVNWHSETSLDLIFANASLQWCPDHAYLFPGLINKLRPGGLLAVQMPDNLSEPSHQLMREIAKRPRWQEQLSAASGKRAVIGSFEAYYDYLSPACDLVDIWRCCYGHVLPGPEAIVQWLQATGLKPYLDPLSVADRKLFLEAYSRAVSQAYPRMSDGRVMLRFPRLFIIARKR